MEVSKKLLTPVKTQFNVEMSCDGCVKTVKTALQKVPGVINVDIDLENQEVVIESTASSIDLLDALRETGKTVNISGQGEGLGTAVCILDDYEKSKGIVRFVQITDDRILIEATISGLPPGLHAIIVHELGDLSRGAESTGGHFNPYRKTHGGPDDTEKHAGDLGNIEVNQHGMGSLRLETDQLKVWDIIGRSVVVHHSKDDLGKGQDGNSKINGNSGLGLVYGIVARSAGVGENRKKICLCDDPKF